MAQSTLIREISYHSYQQRSHGDKLGSFSIAGQSIAGHNAQGLAIAGLSAIGDNMHGDKTFGLKIPEIRRKQWDEHIIGKFKLT